MLEKQKRLNIIKDSQYTFPIHGKIVKFTVKTLRVPKRAKVKVLTEDGEVVFDELIVQNIRTVNPINVIHQNVIVEMDSISTIININGEDFEQINQPEPVIKREAVYSDYFYSLGNVLVTISGLQDGEKIDEIRIITDKSQEQD